MFPILPLRLAADEVPPPPYTPPPVVAVYGDSYTDSDPTPWLETGAPWPERMANSLGVTLANHAAGGSGYVNCPWGSTFPYEVLAHPVPHADVVIVFGGYNDQWHTTTAVGTAAAATFTAARLTMPRAQLLVIGPQWPGETAPVLLWRHRDAIHQAALAAGAAWVDPLAERWFAGRPHLIHADAVHPDDDGMQYLADLIAPHVTRALQSRRMAA